LNFVTCDGVSLPVSLHFYFAPYDSKSWTAFASFSLLLLPLTICIFYRLHSPLSFTWGIELGLLLDVILLNVSLTFEIGQGMPQLPNTVPQALPNSNLILSLWALLLVVLGNAYKGIVMSELTSSLRVTGTHLSVSEMNNFIFYFGDNVDGRIKTAEGSNKPYNIAIFGTEMITVTNLRGCLCHADIPEAISKLCKADGYLCAVKNICPEKDTYEEVDRKLAMPTPPPGKL
jgi:hypothetical protein